MTKSEIKFFLRFLKEKNAYDKFLRIILTNGFEKPCQFLRRVNARQAILSAFFWGNTKEGSVFWGELDINWRQVCNDNALGLDTHTDKRKKRRVLFGVNY